MMTQTPDDSEGAEKLRRGKGNGLVKMIAALGGILATLVIAVPAGAAPSGPVYEIGGSDPGWFAAHSYTMRECSWSGWWLWRHETCHTVTFLALPSGRVIRVPENLTRGSRAWICWVDRIRGNACP